MILPTNGKEFANWSATGVPSGGTLEVEFNDDGNWHALTLVSGKWRILVAGPQAADPGTAVVLPNEKNTCEVRLNAAPEVVVRGGGIIWVKDVPVN